jgi:hypothetical protein
LFRFDLAGKIPSGATVASASLKVQVVRVPAGSEQDSPFILQRVLQSWGEGQETGSIGSAAKAGEATWRARLAPSTLWSKPGGAVPVDFSATISSSARIRGLGSYTFNSTSNLLADIQAWRDNPNENFGWVLRSPSEDTALTARRFGSREDRTDPPVLTIEYGSPLAPCRITGVTITNANVLLTWQGGQAPYQVQTRNDFLQPWSNVGTPITTNTAMAPADRPFAIYRVIAQLPAKQ